MSGRRASPGSSPKARRTVEELLGETARLHDGKPVFGGLGGLGCYVASTHSGATLSLIADELIAGELTTGPRHSLFATFRPERFED